ncbi:MAG: hypothetical protein ACXVNF_01170 [Neobacillus sp.]
MKLSQRQINTSKNNRQKSGKPVQTEIMYDSRSLRDQGYPDLFVLPMKDDIDFYLKGGAIAESHQEFFIKEVDDETNPVNLLNTTGKNFLKDTSALYLTSLPRMHPDFYKHLAISLYGHEVDLNMGNVKGQWFDDPKLENIYLRCLCAELLQIIHRSQLRKITESKKVTVFLAFEDKHQLLFLFLNQFLMEQAVLETRELYDGDKYGLKMTVEKFAQQILSWQRKTELSFGWNRIIGGFPCKISDIDKENNTGEKFRKFLNKHWNEEGKRRVIDRVLKEHNLVVYESKNKQETKMINWADDLFSEHFHDE